MSEWYIGQTILSEYTIEKELGRGGTGRVWLVKSNSTGRRFAVKQVLIRDEKHRKAFLAELQTWIDLPEHPNIVPCRFFRTVGDDVLERQRSTTSASDFYADLLNRKDAPT